MKHKTALTIYEWASYVLIIGATVIYFAFKPQGIPLTLVVLILAVFMRLMMERTRRKACEEENDELKNDLRRLTQLLAEAKKASK
ncbi:MAG: hypothetical protein KBT04_03260 [Bacteroidales bacterium]|nr:hypothetical protein [Candidatus Colimorpha onthohippi]